MEHPHNIRKWPVCNLRISLLTSYHQYGMHEKHLCGVFSHSKINTQVWKTINEWTLQWFSLCIKDVHISKYALIVYLGYYYWLKLPCKLTICWSNTSHWLFHLYLVMNSIEIIHKEQNIFNQFSFYRIWWTHQLHISVYIRRNTLFIKT